jgi:hypothetical protein
VKRADEQLHQQCREAGIDLLLVKPVNSAVIETLLMLESAHLNRLPADSSASLARPGPLQRSRQSAEEQNAAAKAANSRKATHAAPDERPQRRRSIGGSSC